MTSRHVTTMMVPALGLLLAAAPAPAQDVRADVRIRTGPVTGRVVIGGEAHHPREHQRVVVVERGRRPGGRVVVVDRRSARRVTIVEDFRANVQRSHARHDDRHVLAWWDPRTDDYGFQRWRAGLRRVLLCEHGNRFYVLNDHQLDRFDRSRRYDRH